MGPASDDLDENGRHPSPYFCQYRALRCRKRGSFKRKLERDILTCNSEAAIKSPYNTRRHGRDYAEVDDDDGIAPIEARLIEIYFETLRRLANDPANGSSFQNVRILTLEEAIAVLDTQAS